MRYQDRLDAILFSEQATNVAALTRMIEMAEDEIKKTIRKLGPKHQANLIKRIIDHMLNTASELSSAETGKTTKWTVQPRYRPVKEDISGIVASLKDRAAGIVKSVFQLRQPREQQIKMLKGIIGRIKKSGTGEAAQWEFNKPQWQSRNMAKIIGQDVDQAIRTGKTTLKFYLKGMSRETLSNFWDSYQRVMGEKGLVANVSKLPDGLAVDIKASVIVAKMIRAAALRAKQRGPGAGGVYTVYLDSGLIHQAIMGDLGKDAVSKVVRHHLKAAGLDLHKVRLRKAERAAA